MELFITIIPLPLWPFGPYSCRSFPPFLRFWCGEDFTLTPNPQLGGPGFFSLSGLRLTLVQHGVALPTARMPPALRSKSLVHASLVTRLNTPATRCRYHWGNSPHLLCWICLARMSRTMKYPRNDRPRRFKPYTLWMETEALPPETSFAVNMIIRVVEVYLSPLVGSFPQFVCCVLT